MPVARGSARLDAGPLHSYKWARDISSNAVTGLSREVREVDVTVTFYGLANADAAEQAFEEDLISGTPGTLSLGEWSQRALVVEWAEEERAGAVVDVTLTLALADGAWTRVTSLDLLPEGGTTTTTTGLDYPYDHPYDFAGTSVSAGVGGSGSLVVGSPFLVRATFYGPCSNPYVRVTSRAEDGTSTSNYFGVDSSAESGERIVIDPLGMHELGASVYRVGAYGEETNLFDARRRGVAGSGSYVFERMPAGTVEVAWPQSFGVTFEAIEERGALPWT